jgi:sialate O-acetylesterase
MKLKAWIGMALGVLATGMAAAGDLAVSAYWQDHMVLQRGRPITVWGKDVAGRKVTVSFTNQTATAVTGSDGFWETTFEQPFETSATPQTLTISNNVNETIAISDVLVGDVFLAGGQSNMDRRLDDLPEPQSIKDFCGDDDGIRYIRIARTYENATAGEQLFDLPPIKAVNTDVGYYGHGHDWAPATGEARLGVSSVALNFAHYVRDANAARGEDIPIGIVHASSGGTAIRTWISKSVLAENGYSAGDPDGWFWNTMMAPILRAKFRAILWYQGCSDAEKQPAEYKKLMDVLVKDRRDRWGDGGDLPFYAVQIGTAGYYGPNLDSLDHYPAPTEDPYESNYVRIREAQRLWDASDAGTHGLVTIVDCVPCLGAGDLHPKDKNFVGRRLSLLARRDIYGETDLQAEGPVFTRAVREANGAVRVFFRSGTAKGLTAGRMKPATDIEVSRWVKKGSDPIRGFAICGADGAWKEAEATVEGETVVLRADGVASPTKFHYGYWSTTRITELEDGQRLNLYNGDGLPMSPVAPQAVEDPDASGKVADPVLTPASCFFSPSTNVTIACATSGATVRYTLDGSEPTASSAIYSAPIALTTDTTVKARAFAEGKAASDVVFATYTLGEPPAQEPDPQWEPGVYKFAEWTPLANNLLAGLTTAYTANSLDPWNGSVVCLTDGTVSSDLDDDTVGIGIRDGATLSWSFAAPKTIETIRLTACGYNHLYKYDKILVVSVEALQDGEWNPIGGSVAFNGPDSYGSDQSLYATLADDVTGLLATNATGLRITFGNPKNLGKCRYAEIEASGYDSSGGPTETVETPAFDPAACSFFPSTNVAISCATLGATIRYTLDGTAPTASSTPYTAPIALAATTTVKARAYAEGMNPSAIATATYTYVDPVQPVYDIAIAACENGTLETSATNDIPAGTVVTVTATPAAGYRLASVTTNGAALAGTAFAMPAGDVALAATFEEQGEPTRMFYIGDTGYDSWTDVYAAAKAGDTIVVGANAEIRQSSGTISKSITIDLCGRSLNHASGWLTGCSIDVVDTGATPGQFVVSAYSMNVSGGTLDLSSLASDQVTGRFQMSGTTLLAFPGDRPFADCTSAITTKAEGARIVVQGGTYTWDGSRWVPEGHDITIEAPQNGTLETSATNNVAAGTVVTVTATPAAGYELASVTTNGAALAGTTFEMLAEDVTVAATFAEKSEPTHMFYIGDTGYDSWTNAYNAAKPGDTIVVGANAVIDPPANMGVLGKSLTIDLNGRTLEVVECWLTGCTVAIVDSGTPAGSGRFKIVPTGMNISGGTLDLSALSDDQVTGYFQMSSTSLLKSPGDRSMAYSTTHLWFDTVDPAHGVGARLVVRGLTYVWDGVSWGVSFRITSIAVDDEFVELGVLVAPEYGVSPYVTILGCETLDGTFHARPDATTDDGSLYRLPVSEDRFFKAVMGMPD